MPEPTRCRKSRDEPEDDEVVEDEPEEEEPGEDDDDDDEDDEDSQEERPADPPHIALASGSPAFITSRASSSSTPGSTPATSRHAPAWIDKNWVAYGDYDELRDIPPGPCLRVPLPSGVTAMVRIGDYLATQEVKLAEGLTDIRLEAWPRDQFEKLFIPRPAIDLTPEHA